MTALRRRSLGFLLWVWAGCGRVGFDASVDGGTTNPTGDTAADAQACTFSSWSAPALVSALDSGAAESGAQISGDGLTIYFGVNNVIYVARRATRTAVWSTPVQVGISGGVDDDPSYTADELELYLSRMVGSSFCLFMSQRSSSAVAWPAPTQMSGFCAGMQDAGPYVTADGLTLMYTQSPVGTPEGTLMVSTRANRTTPFTPGLAVAGISATNVGYAALSADQRTIYFEGGAPLDLYVAMRPDVGSPFGPATAITEANLPASSEEDPSITGDGLELYFDSDRGGNQDIYVSTRSCL